MGVRVEFADQGERLIARPRGRLEFADGTDFATSVKQRLQSSTKAVTIDLDELDFIDLGGVRSVLQLARSLKAAERRLDFAHGSEAVRDALKQAGFDELFAFAPPLHSHRGIS